MDNPREKSFEVEVEEQSSKNLKSGGGGGVRNFWGGLELGRK